MSRQSEVQPLSRDEVLRELAFLLTVEHALIVEYLSVACALGYDLEAADGGPETEAARDAATAAIALAADEMLRAAALVRALSRLRPTGGFGRARVIADADDREIPLGPPTREQLEHLLEREEAIAAAVDARYARLRAAVAAGGPGEDAFSDDLRAAVQQGTTHASGVSVLRHHLGNQPVADLLRATRRFGSTAAEKVLLRMSDRTYGLVLGALENFYADLDGVGMFRSLALNAMDVMNDVNRTLVHAGLLPRFQLPPA